MLTFYHSPRTRSTRVLALLHAMGVLDQVEIHMVEVPRQDGSGGADPANPHPEGKVPLLVHDGEVIRETNAIMLYLTDHFASALGRQVGQTGRGTYLSWLAYYGNVVEPVVVAQVSGAAAHPAVVATFRGMAEIRASLAGALASGPYLMGEAMTAADYLMASPFLWFPDFTPDDPKIRAWVQRCRENPSQVWAVERDGPPPAA